jgi:arginyl-tRNA--protein-N-Asp/Glu arginylyltransferase
MKIVSTQKADFDIYIGKSDTRYIEREEDDSLEAMYSSGYLPYSGAAGVQNIFYSARSARVVLPEFKLTSENRRIAKKFDGQFTKERIPKANFAATEDFWRFCLTYFATKHGERAMPRARLETIMQSRLVNTVVVYKKDALPVAYVLEVEDGSMGHFWFSFYDLSYAKQSLGLWLMLDALRDAKERGLTHYYLGTVYGEKARYKLNFIPLQWWDQDNWNSDIKTLRLS